MRKLTAMPPPHNVYHNEVVQLRNNPRRTRLQGIQGGIHAAFEDYEQRLANGTLGAIVPMNLVDPLPDDLRNCYSTFRDDLFVRIRSNQPDELRATCQYCGINESTTLDHFIPESDFPEFSVFVLNLVLACPHCNLRKLRVWRDNGLTLFLHLYHDEIEANQFLFCEILARNGVFVPRFRLANDGTISAQLFQRIQQHFQKLELFQRFVDMANSHISGVRGDILSTQFMFSRGQKRRLLKRQAISKRGILGRNNWITVLHEGMAASNQFLDSASSPHRPMSKAWLKHKFTGIM